MIKYIKSLIVKYIICKHTSYSVIRKIMYPFDSNRMKYFERRKCNSCGREYYSDYFYEYGSERHYVK